MDHVAHGRQDLHVVLTKIFLPQRRKGAKKTCGSQRSSLRLCAFAPLRKKYFMPGTAYQAQYLPVKNLLYRSPVVLVFCKEFALILTRGPRSPSPRCNRVVST